MERQGDFVGMSTLNVWYYNGMAVLIAVVSQEARDLVNLDIIHPKLHQSDEVVLHHGDMDGLVDHEDHRVAVPRVIVGKSGRDSSKAPFNTKCRVITSDINWTVEVLDY